MNPENEFNDRLIRLPELERIFGVCKRTVRRRAENGELQPLRRIGRAVVSRDSARPSARFERAVETVRMHGVTRPAFNRIFQVAYASPI